VIAKSQQKFGHLKLKPCVDSSVDLTAISEGQNLVDEILDNFPQAHKQIVDEVKKEEKCVKDENIKS
jgi:thymidylate synthase ThyX